MNKKHWILLTAIWVLFIVLSFIWNYTLVISNNNKLVNNRAKAIFQQIVVTRSWNSSHGGVYVPVTPQSQPNPYLEDSLSDLVTVDGLQLTKINPAYMTRQISEINSSNTSLRFHITSLNPIRPANEADEWETKALKNFEHGASEIMERVKNKSVPEYRYMAPLFVEKSCLQCHAKQGYKEGQVRGGISISFPATIYLSGIRQHALSLAVVHFILLLGGMAGLLAYYRTSNKHLAETENRNLELEQISATKDKFFSIIAHDLKSPFNSILGFSELLVEQINEKDYNGIEQYAEIIQQSSQKAVNLLMNLMEWSRSQTGRMEFNPERFDLKESIQDITALFDDVAGQKGIVIKSEWHPKAIVFADQAMINTVLRNLISNAIKFTNPGGVISLAVTAEKNKLTVSVKDNGIGIPKEWVEKLFRIEESRSTSGTASETGTGLGLILCKEFIEKHDEQIWVESKEGNGSTFYFTLPYHTEPPAETIERQPTPSDSSAGIRKLKILIAEDDKVSEMLIDRYINMFGKEILKARTGVDAVDACRDNPDIDLVLMDIRMPSMDGHEATRQIREFNKEVIIIAQTAYGLTGDRERAIDAGCNDYIAKPINKDELLKLIQKYFG